MWKSIVAGALDRADVSVARIRRAVSRPQTLTVLLLHAITRGFNDADCRGLDPVQAVTVGQLETLLDCCQQAGCTFVSPADVRQGRTGPRSVLLTFDDGYFNNHLAFDILGRRGIPSVLFISTGHIEGGKKFWWDVVHAERARQGATPMQISREKSTLKLRPYYEIERHIDDTFGRDAWRPTGDADRPMSPEELARLAGDPLITIGNHTVHHAILTALSPAEALAEIEGAQASIASITGCRSEVISYPNGNCSPAIREIAVRQGLRIGLTVRPRQNRLPFVDGMGALRLARFCISGDRDIPAQFEACLGEPRFDTPSAIEGAFRRDTL